MTDINKVEYQTVILGALLHDVGKLWQVTSRSGPHWEGSNSLAISRSLCRISFWESICMSARGRALGWGGMRSFRSSVGYKF